MLKLYSYFRSSASYRVRIGLNWKGLHYQYLPVHLINDGGQQHKADYRKVNPMGHVPALDHEGFLVAESVAILDYVDHMFPFKPLFPSHPKERARVLQVCELINSGIQPLQNLKVNQYFEKEFGHSKGDTERWNRHWIERGLESLEKLLSSSAGTYCFGGDFTAADCFLVPQCFAARRFGVRLEKYPVIMRIDQACSMVQAVQAAHPEKQPDFSP
jgi:maleylacetoacetate isomerase